MDVSENSGTPKSSILIGIPIINHPFWGTPIFGRSCSEPQNPPNHRLGKHLTPLGRSAGPHNSLRRLSTGGLTVNDMEMQPRLGKAT